MFTFLLKSIYLPFLTLFRANFYNFQALGALFLRDSLRRWLFAFLLLSELFGGLRNFKARSQRFSVAYELFKNRVKF